MVSRKRAREETEAQSAPEPQEHGLLHQLRNMWEFPNLMQYIYTFGKPMKLDDDIDIEELETECLKPGHSERLLNIGLNLLKFVSSHRGLNYDNFEEYTRRQYLAKAPLRNPFGDDESPLKFHQLDIFQRIRVLQQLSAWTLWNPDRFRERMGEVKESDQLQWRINEIGYDRDEHQYYVLDDNRLYRRIEPQIPPERPVKRKATSRKRRAGIRSSKRRKVADTPDETDGQEDEADAVPSNCSRDYEWECVAITLNDYNTFIDSLKKSKDLNEQALYERLVEDVLPVIEKVEELQQKKALRREKELIALEKLATAKRSSRIASKQDRIRQEQQAAEEAKRQEAERIAEQKAKEKAQKIEKERQYRLMTREQRLKDREEKRKQQEEELVRLTEKAKLAEEGEARSSRRNFNAELEKRQKGLENLEVEDWTFDCSGCGIHGENLDDGSHSVACDKCNVWQHSKCLGISQEEAEKDDFHFICKDCQRRIEEAKRPKIPPLKFRITSSASPPSKKEPQVSNGSILTKQQPTNHQNVSSTQQFRPAPIEPRLFTSNRPPVASHSIYAQNGSPQPGYPPAPQSNTAVSYGHQPAPVHTLPQASIPRNMMSSFSSQRPTSSGSIPSNFPSPVQNRPSMSPTQGNGDVGPLAGFPPAPAPAPTSSAPSPGSNGTYSGTTYQCNPSGYSPYSSFQIQQHPQQQHQHQQRNQNQGLQQQHQRQQYHPSSQSPTTSFSATTNHQASFSQTPPSNRYSPGIPMSGLSPTKHSPAQTASSSEVGVQPVVPPVQRLQPSPKLMGRTSPDAPIPAPMKSMAAETILTTNGMPQHHHQPRILNYSPPTSTHPISFEHRQPESQSQCSPRKST